MTLVMHAALVGGQNKIMSGRGGGLQGICRQWTLTRDGTETSQRAAGRLSYFGAGSPSSNLSQLS